MLVEPEQLRLERVPPLRDVVARLHRVDERLHRLVARLVGQVAARDPGRVAAQPVVDRLVDEQRVEHERARAQPGLEPDGDRFGGGAAHLAVGRHQLRQALLQAHLGAGAVEMVTVIADVSSENSRTHALLAVSDLSARMRSSGSVSRCGR